jgi:predicted RNase H-like HicB family nuclease
MKQYIALIRKEKKSCYGVDFPDFPGCITSGDTIEDAQARAIEALDLHVDGMVEDGDPLPEATGLNTILEDPDNHEGLVLAVQVPLVNKKSKKVRVDITIPEDVSRQVDRFVKNTEGVNRSSFFVASVMERLQRIAPAAAHKPVKVQVGRTTVSTRKGKAGDAKIHGAKRASKHATLKGSRRTKASK